MKKVKPLSSLTKHEAEVQSKILSGEMGEELDATGQESETKAAKWVMEKGEIERHEEDEKSAEEEWKLYDNRKKFFTYNEELLKVAIRRMEEYPPPKGFAWIVKLTKQGLVFIIGDSKGQMYARGMKVSGIPKYDLNAIDRILMLALDNMEALENRYQQDLIDKAAEQAKKEKKSEGGIHLP